MRADQGIRLERVPRDQQPIGIGRFGEQAVTTEMLSHGAEQARLVGSRPDPVEVLRERVGAARARQRVHQIGLCLVGQIHAPIDPPAGGVKVEDLAERIRRLDELVQAEPRPTELVERDCAQRRVGALRRVLVVGNALGVAVVREADVAHAHVGFLAIARPGVGGHELLEDRRRLGIGRVGQDHPGVEQHRIEVREVAILAEDRAVDLERPRGVDRRHYGVGRAGRRLLADEARHLLAERLACVD